MRTGRLAALALVAWGCASSPPPAPPPGPSTPADATLACAAQYRFDLGSGAFASAVVLGDGPVTLQAGTGQPRPDSVYQLLDGLAGSGDLDGDGSLESVVVVNWRPGAGTGSVDYVVVLGDRGGGLACLAAIALGDRERLLRLGVEDGRIALDGFAHGDGEPLAVATQRVLAQLRFEGYPALPGAARARRQLVGPVLPASLERVTRALAPALSLPEPEGLETAVYAPGGPAGLDARVYVPGPRAVEMLLRLPATAAAQDALERVLAALDPTAAGPLAACLAAHRADLAGAERVRFTWCAASGLAAPAWGRRTLQVIYLVSAEGWRGDPPWVVPVPAR